MAEDHETGCVAGAGECRSEVRSAGGHLPAVDDETEFVTGLVEYLDRLLLGTAGILAARVDERAGQCHQLRLVDQLENRPFGHAASARSSAVRSRFTPSSMRSGVLDAKHSRSALR